jgi:hypothetical protein
MTILPLITCAFGIGLAALFEAAYNYVAERWSTPALKEEWCGIFWVLVVAVLVLCKVMPYTPPQVFPWAPFIIVAVIHIMMANLGGGFSRLSDAPLSSPAGHANPPSGAGTQYPRHSLTSKPKTFTKTKGVQP